MIEETIAKIETALKRIEATRLNKKPELIRLLAALKDEIKQLSRTHDDQARSIVGFTEVAVHEASRRDRAPDLQKLSLAGLSSSVKGFEASHPRLVEATNEICNLLASIGI